MERLVLVVTKGSKEPRETQEKWVKKEYKEIRENQGEMDCLVWMADLVYLDLLVHLGICRVMM